MGQLSDAIDREFGVRTRLIINPVTGSVGTTATEILRNNPDRLSWVIINLSANFGFIDFTPQVAATRGIRLSANGGSAAATWRDDGELVGHPVFALLDTAAGDFYVVEVEAR